MATSSAEAIAVDLARGVPDDRAERVFLLERARHLAISSSEQARDVGMLVHMRGEDSAARRDGLGQLEDTGLLSPQDASPEIHRLASIRKVFGSGPYV